MISRSALNRILYAFAVLMILLRPFGAYQMAKRGAFANDPNRVYLLLQRLIKKKETHTEDAQEAAEISAETPVVILPVAFIFLKRAFASFISLFTRIVVSTDLSTIFKVSPSNHYYCLISRFQI